MGGIGGGKCLLEKPVLKVRMCLTSSFCLISRENPVFKAMINPARLPHFNHLITH